MFCFSYSYIHLPFFSMIMTGKLLIGLIVTLSLFSYGTLIIALFRLLAIRFFSTYFLKVDAYWFSWFKSLYITTDGSDGLSSPLLAYISTLNQMSNQTVLYKLILFSVIGTVVFLLLGIFFVSIAPYRNCRETYRVSKSRICTENIIEHSAWNLRCILS